MLPSLLPEFGRDRRNLQLDFRSPLYVDATPHAIPLQDVWLKTDDSQCNYHPGIHKSHTCRMIPVKSERSESAETDPKGPEAPLSPPPGNFKQSAPSGSAASGIVGFFRNAIASLRGKFFPPGAPLQVTRNIQEDTATDKCYVFPETGYHGDM